MAKKFAVSDPTKLEVFWREASNLLAILRGLAQLPAMPMPDGILPPVSTATAEAWGRAHPDVRGHIIGEPPFLLGWLERFWQAGDTAYTATTDVQARMAIRLVYGVFGPTDDAKANGCREVIEFARASDGMGIQQYSYRLHELARAGELEAVQREQPLPTADSRQMERVPPTYLDQFRKVLKRVERISKKDIDRVSKIHEVEVRSAFEKMLGEPFPHTDSGVEKCDFYSGQPTHEGEHVWVAATFKGPGARAKTLRIRHYGTNGDQILKLFEVPADVYIVQGNATIDPVLAQHIEHEAICRTQFGHSVKYMVIDVTMTAKLLWGAQQKKRRRIGRQIQ